MKNKNPLRAFLIILLVLILGYGLSWAVTIGIIKLITICFGLRFSLAYATGIWLVLILLRIIFSKKKGHEDE
jgi:hypothetical protein